MNPFLGVHSNTAANRLLRRFRRSEPCRRVDRMRFVWWGRSYSNASSRDPGRRPCCRRACRRRGRYCRHGDHATLEARHERRGGSRPSRSARRPRRRRTLRGPRRRGSPATAAGPARRCRSATRGRCSCCVRRTRSRRCSPRSRIAAAAADRGPARPRGGGGAGHRAGRADHPRLAQRPGRPQPRRPPPGHGQADRRGQARPEHRLVRARLRGAARRTPLDRDRRDRRQLLPAVPGRGHARQHRPAPGRAVVAALGDRVRALPRLPVLRRLGRHRGGRGARAAR